MKSSRRFLAGFLSLALFFSSADFGVFDLSPIIAHAAEQVTDVYDAVAAYERLETITDFDQNLLSLDKDLADGVSSGLRDDTSNVCGDTEFENNGEPEALGTMFGRIYQFHQKDIDAAAQFKAGDWLTKTEYDSQFGTPTTESLFLTAGGTQWIVNCDYRYLTTDYVRRYRFDADGDNYRYVKVDPKDMSVDNPEIWKSDVRYQHTMTNIDAHTDFSEKITPIDAWPNDLPYEDGILRDNNGSGSDLVLVGNIAFTNYTVPSLGYTGSYSGTLVTDSNYTTWAGVDISANRDIGNDATNRTASVQPAVAECILYKRAILTALKDLNDTFMSMDDNYRADFGYYNTDNPEDPDYEWYNYRPDQASWMFTYESMLRRSANNYTTNPCYEGANWLFTGNGFAVNPRESGDRYFSMHPTCVSYWLDQSGLYIHDAMDPSVQSNFMTPYTLGAVSGYTGYNPADYLKEQLTGMYRINLDVSGYCSSVTPIALSISDGDPVSYVALKTDVIEMLSTGDRRLQPFTNSLVYNNPVSTPRIKRNENDIKDYTYSPVNELYQFLAGSYSNGFLTTDVVYNTYTDMFTSYGLNGFIASEMAAFSAPHYVQRSAAWNESLGVVDKDIFGRGSNDLEWKLPSVDGSTFVYDKTFMGGNSSFNGRGNFSAVLCDYYRTLYNLYFMVAPFLVNADFNNPDYKFLLEIPGVAIDSGHFDENISLANAAHYFGSTANVKWSSLSENRNSTFSFMLASFPIGGDLDGAMENQYSFNKDSMFYKGINDSTFRSELTDTVEGCNITAWSQKYLKNAGTAVWDTYALLCFAAPYYLTEYNYTVQYTLSRDGSSVDDLHTVYSWKQKDAVAHHHTYTDGSGNTAEWYQAPADAAHHIVCHSAANHDANAEWKKGNCGYYEDLVKCSVCSGTGKIECDDTDAWFEGDLKHYKNYWTDGSCDSTCPTDNPATPQDEGCHDDHDYCDYCDSESCSTNGKHYCDTCAGSGYFLCPGCWWKMVDTDHDSVDDTEVRPDRVAYTAANRAAWNNCIPCLNIFTEGQEKVGGYTGYCEYPSCEGYKYPDRDEYNHCTHTYSYSDLYGVNQPDYSLHVSNINVVALCGNPNCEECLSRHKNVSYTEKWDIHYEVHRAVEDIMYNPIEAPNDTQLHGAWQSANSTCWDSFNKRMEAHFGITQRFNNVKYVDITDYTIWSLDHSVSRGLSNILVLPVAEEIKSNVIQSLGLVIYDNRSDEVGTNYISSDGHVYSTTLSGQFRDYVTNAQGGMGRVANSFYSDSMGNSVNDKILMVDGYANYYGNPSSYTLLNNILGDKTVQFQYYNRVSDVPFMYKAGSPTSVNKRMYAFKVNLNDPDYLRFSYKSNYQGGRSSTTFYAFVAQAVANTLFCKDYKWFNDKEASRQLKLNSLLAYRSTHPSGSSDQDNAVPNAEIIDGVVGNITDDGMYDAGAVTTDILANTYCTPYSNSILIQGDYLAVQNADGTYTTIIGSMHDTWDDRKESDIKFGNTFDESHTLPFDTDIAGGRFSLAGQNALGNRYLSSGGWIKACYSEIFTRVDPEHLWEWIFGSSTAADSISNCVFIHTFVGALNDFRSTVFDSVRCVEGAIKWDDVNAGSWNLSFQGSANALRSYISQNAAVWRTHFEITRHSLVGYDTISHFAKGVNRLNDLTIIDKYDDFRDTANNKCVVLKQDAPCSDNTIGIMHNDVTIGFDILYLIDCNDTADVVYKSMGTYGAVNKSNSSFENRTKTLSYVGYGADTTPGIGDQEITLTGNEDSCQKGYLSGDTTTFLPFETFVSNRTTDLPSLTDNAGNNFNNGYNPVEIRHASNPSPKVKSFTKFGVQNLVARPRYIWKDSSLNVANGSSTVSTFSSTEFSELYPHVQELNIKRTLPNGEYMTGDTDLIYKVFATNEGRTDDLSVHAGYNKGVNASEPSKYTTNNIVIFNPVSTETATVKSLGNHTPDGANRGVDGGYLTEGYNTVARNTITVNRYATTLAETGSELIVTNTSYVEGKPATSTVKTKVLRDFSMADTKAYTYNDYIETRVDKPVVDVWQTGTMTVTEDGYYNVEVKHGSNKYFGQLHAFAGDMLYKDGNTIMYQPKFDAELRYIDIAEAYLNGTTDVPPMDVTNKVPVKTNAVYTVSVVDSSSSYASIDMTKGAALQLCLPVQNDVGMPQAAETLSISVNTSSGSASVNLTKREVKNNAYYNYYTIVANTDCSIISVTIAGPAGTDSSLCGDYIMYDPDLAMLSVVPTPIGTVTAGTIKYVTTQEYFNNAGSWTDAYMLVNKDILEIQGESGMSGAVSTENEYACIQSTDSTYSWKLKDTALMNPHMVEHSNWRYYVVGTDWTFATGRTITKGDISSDASPLYDDTTWLLTPNGYYITVGSMDLLASKNDATTAALGYYASDLVAINTGSGIVLSVYGDTTRARGINIYRDLELSVTVAPDGSEVSELVGVNPVAVSDIGYAYNADMSCLDRMLTFNNIKMNSQYYLPLSFGSTENVTHKPVSEGISPTSNCSYDYVWFCTGKSGSNFTSHSIDYYAYDVKTSTDLAHKYTADSMNWNIDWKEKEKVITSYDSEASNNPAPTSLLNLDDEFVIYWNNLSNIVVNPPVGSNKPTYEGSATLGRGWNNISDAYDGVSSNVTNRVKTINSSGYTDTTKWIYRKYVTFSVDMYCFTTDAGKSGYILKSIDDCRADGTDWDTQVNPTTPAYSGTTPNYVVFIPAGTEVPLGYYSMDSTLNDDDGRFIDYGNTDVADDALCTNDPNHKLYTYHFWTPLSDGESYDEVIVNYRVESINGVGNSDNDLSIAVNAAGGKTDVSQGFTSTAIMFGVQPNLMTHNFARVLDTMRDDWDEPTLYPYNPSIVNNQSVIKRVDFTPLNTGHLDATGKRVNPLAETLEATVANGLRYGSSFKTNTLSIVGRVGGLTVVDTGDPRWQDTFKTGGSSYAIAPIVKAVTRFVNKGESEVTAEGTQNLYMQDIIDVRGRYVLEPPTNYNTYNNSGSLNTYNTQMFKTAASVASLPLKTSYNEHADSLNLEGIKLGYELLCSLDTTGNYFGSVSKRTASGTELPSNNNGDYGQTKIQIRPIYFGVTESGDVELADVYMRKGSEYVLINAGTPYYGASQAAADTSNYNSSALSYIKAAPYYSESIHSADYTMAIPTNTHDADADGDNVLNATSIETKEGLDANMLRRMVTDFEANATLRASDIDAYMGKSLVTTSFIEKYALSANDGAIGSVAVDSTYTYGNAQLMYLREPNRTLVGGASVALGYDDASMIQDGRPFVTDNAELYAQKWYFGMKLPTNAIFVKHGSTNVSSKTKAYRYVICTLEVYAVGEKWVLRYESPIGQSAITTGSYTFDWEAWNKIKETNPYLLPVTYYDLSDNASSDFDTRGSY